MAEQELTSAPLVLRRLEARALDEINAVVRDAALGWAMPARVKRLSVPLLQYDSVDLQQFQALGAYEADDACFTAGAPDRAAMLGVAVWDERLLHGLYVRPEVQGRGVGRQLLWAVAREAGSAGVERLTVKAQRVSAGYFEQLGLARIEDAAYPYAYELVTGSVAAG